MAGITPGEERNKISENIFQGDALDGKLLKGFQQSEEWMCAVQTPYPQL